MNLTGARHLKELGLVPIQKLGKRVWLCTDAEGRKLVYKRVRDLTEINLYTQAFPVISGQGLTNLRSLVLPSILDTDGKSWLTVPYYEGESYSDRWNELEPGKWGGIGLACDLSQEMADMILDLTKINITPLKELSLFRHEKRAFFEYDKWLLSFNERGEEMIRRGLLAQSDMDGAKEILREDYVNNRHIFSNGDVYPRNVIKTTRGLVLIDWQGWSKDYRVNFFDTVENIIAFSYVHMWNNFAWQHGFIKAIRKNLNISPVDFQVSLLIKSFDQAYVWRPTGKNLQKDIDLRELCKFQLQIFLNAMSTEYINQLFSSTATGIARIGFLSKNSRLHKREVID